MNRIRWWQWIPIFGWRIVAVVESVNDVPVRLPRNGVVLVGVRSKPKWVAFDCPCRGGHRILLNADKVRYPCWSIVDGKKLSISPSIDYSDPHKRCHYFIRDGCIDWAQGRIGT